MFCFEGFHCLSIICVNLLQVPETCKLIIVLQHIFKTQVLSEQFSKVFSVSFRGYAVWVGKTLLQLIHHFYKAALFFSGC